MLIPYVTCSTVVAMRRRSLALFAMRTSEGIAFRTSAGLLRGGLSGRFAENISLQLKLILWTRRCNRGVQS